MFRTYCGEYLIHPAALHFGFNYCSHGCFYCFANLNKPDRRVDMKSVVSQLKKINNDEFNTLESWFLKKGHPVLMSNDTDPLANSNIESFIQVHEALLNAGVKMVYQTKGGKLDHEQIMLDDDPTMFYISITSDNNDLLKRSEPGAPSFEHRLDLVKRAKAKGHHVIIGINPFVPWWWDDLNGSLQKLKDLGVYHLWTGDMHLSPDQLKNMPKNKQLEFESEIKEARKRHSNIQYESFQKWLDRLGFYVYDLGNCNKTGFWDEYFKLGFPFYPTVNGFFTNLSKYGDVVAFDFEYFNAWANLNIPFENSRFKEYIRPFRRTVYNKTGKEPVVRNMRQVNEMFFNVRENKTPFQSDNVSFALENELQLVDKNGIDILVWSREKFNPDDVFFDINKNQVNFCIGG